MLLKRIIGGLTFNKQVYKEVEHDKGFTTIAWLIVVVVAFLNQIGTQAYRGLSEIFLWGVSAIYYTVFAVIGFAVAAFVISWVGKTLFKADVNFGEMVRCLGLAYIWNIFGVFGVVGGVFGALACLTGPIAVVAGFLGLAAWFFAVKEALDLDWVPTIVTVIIGWVASMIISAIGLLIFGGFQMAVNLLS